VVAMRLNSNLVQCPGCRTNVNPYIIVNQSEAEKEVECPSCCEKFLIVSDLIGGRGLWRALSQNVE
jgi:hypothetical protein